MHGDARIILHDVAATSNAQNIVLGWRGHSRLRRLLLGSTSDYIVRSVNLTTVVVPELLEKVETQMDTGKKWMVAVDGSDASFLALKWALKHIRKSKDEIYLASVLGGERSSKLVLSLYCTIICIFGGSCTMTLTSYE